MAGILDLLNPQDKNYLGQQRDLGLASGLLAASGYSKTPTSLGQALGAGLQGAQQAGAQAQAQQLAQEKEARLQQQQNLINSLYSSILPKSGSKLPPGYVMKMTPRGPELTYDPLSAAKAEHEGIIPSGGQRPSQPRGEANPYASVNINDLTPKARQAYEAKIVQERPGAYAAYTGMEQSMNDLKSSAESLLARKEAGKFSTGRTSVIASSPLAYGTESYDWSTDFETLKSKVMLNALKSLRQLSKNGSSGFGQLNQSEGDALRNSITSLEKARSWPAVEKSLKQIAKYTDRVQGTAKKAFEMTYGPLPKEQAQSSDTSNPQTQPTAPQAAVQYLMNNDTPEIRRQFKEKYGYLPKGM